MDGRLTGLIRITPVSERDSDGDRGTATERGSLLISIALARGDFVRALTR
jgi:hypothetical protein